MNFRWAAGSYIDISSIDAEKWYETGQNVLFIECPYTMNMWMPHVWMIFRFANQVALPM